ncbi:probable mitochondrial saccharopine dehydrogenase-like oxidoreductase At5g39410 [Chenopodium quinoa]|uniref:probable mitochondrial saccharopine dehydrogenase-like oxidoreductase At5g39410 n=1 Tax=Chenopodium quinoa TaxID=63459 RepID=UPI000B78969D|nr:probable mitochondrial saccharopine dehydrogenase-like oxidoreductase At5g39410 [Chenopodium quinoa]
MAEETHLSTPPPPYNIIILGASGFTSKYVLKESLKFLNSSSPSSPLKSLAIAGRNPTKLAQSLSWESHPNPPPNITILTADTLNFDSLLHISSLTKLILNCVGPFRLHGDLVVRACLETRTDYLEICGELEFMKKMEVQYHDQAFDKGCLVVSAYGFDSVLAELGLLFNSRQWVSPSAPNTIKATNIQSSHTIKL